LREATPPGEYQADRWRDAGRCLVRRLLLYVVPSGVWMGWQNRAAGVVAGVAVAVFYSVDAFLDAFGAPYSLEPPKPRLGRPPQRRIVVAVALSVVLGSLSAAAVALHDAVDAVDAVDPVALGVVVALAVGLTSALALRLLARLELPVEPADGAATGHSHDPRPEVCSPAGAANVAATGLLLGMALWALASASSFEGFPRVRLAVESTLGIMDVVLLAGLFGFLAGFVAVTPGQAPPAVAYQPWALCLPRGRRAARWAATFAVVVALAVFGGMDSRDLLWPYVGVSGIAIAAVFARQLPTVVSDLSRSPSLTYRSERRVTWLMTATEPVPAGLLAGVVGWRFGPTVGCVVFVPLAVITIGVCCLPLASDLPGVQPPVVQELWLAQLVLELRGYGRVRFVRLLQDALDLHLLRQSGSGLQFRHVQLQRYLTDEYGSFRVPRQSSFRTEEQVAPSV
jgi:hypothetical protein